MGFSRQEYWSGLPFPSPGDPADPGIEPRSLAFRLPETIKLAHRFSAMGLSEEACGNLLYAGANSSLSQTLSHLL